jgi:predicted transcriptional regulator of viral defense system
LKRETHLPKIRDRITRSKKGTVFVPSDFKDIADRNVIKMALSRICDEQIVRRVMRGVYEYPEYSNLLQEFAVPSPDKIAQALARNFGWSIVPYGDTALNLLGLSTQVPNVWFYVSDGPYRNYEFNNIHLKFKHTTNKEITGISYKTALIIQALKTLGKNRVDDKVIRKLSSLLSKNDKELLICESRYVTSWVHEVLKQIVKRGDKNT